MRWFQVLTSCWIDNKNLKKKKKKKGSKSRIATTGTYEMEIGKKEFLNRLPALKDRNSLLEKSKKRVIQSR